MHKFLQSKWLFITSSIIVLASVLGYWVSGGNPRVILPAVALLTVMMTLIGFKQLYWLLLFCLPLSIEYEVGRTGFATDLPTEPLMILLMMASIFYFLVNYKKIDKQFFRHPLIQLILLHFLWIIITTIYSSFFLVSFKFLLAKTWYLVVFLWLTSFFVKKEQDFKIPFWCITIPFFASL